MTLEAPHSFEAWLRAPHHWESPDPRIEIRRARPDEFEAVFDLVDAAFGSRRPRALYDWLYRRNPLGVARCWLVLEEGRLVATAARWPWPLARGSEPVPGVLAGDAAVAHAQRGRRLSDLRVACRQHHPIEAASLGFAWPNALTLGRFRGSPNLVGRLHEGVRSLRRLRPAGWWARLRERDGGKLRVEEVAHFDGSFDALARCGPAWEGLWSPRDARFLDWRYRQHPLHRHRILAACEGEEPRGFAVVRTDPRTAQLVELVAPARGPALRRLLDAAAAAACQEGCRRLAVLAGPAWPHWPALGAAGFSRGPGRPLLVTAPRFPEAFRIERWQLGLGDVDD